MLIPGDKRILLVADRDYHLILHAWKKDQPAANIKIIRPNDLLDLASFSYVDDPVPHLLKMGNNYQKAKKLAKFFRVIDLGKASPMIQEAFEALPKDSYEVDPYGEYELKSSEIWLIEMEEDIEIHGLLKRKGYPFTDVTFQDLGLKRLCDFDKDDFTVKEYPDIYSQYFTVFASLRERLLKDPSLQDRILIHGGESGDDFHAEAFARLFGIELFSHRHIPFLSNPTVQLLLKRFDEEKAFRFDEGSDDPAAVTLARLVKDYGLAELPDFGFAYSNLLEIISDQKEVTHPSNKGTQYYTNYPLFPDKEIYILDFKDGDFYKTYDEDGGFSDELLLKMGANPSYIRTKLDRRKKRNFIEYQKVIHLSRPLQHLSEALYDSPFILEHKGRFGKIKKNLSNDGVYTLEAAKMRQATHFDALSYRKSIAKQDFRTYDFTFKGLPKGTDVYANRKAYSLTTLENYINCPYQFYLKIVLPLEEDDYHARWRGTLIHKVFEDIYHPDYDFEKAFEAGKKEYLDAVMKDVGEVTPLEEAYLELLRRGLGEYVPQLMKITAQMKGVSHSDVAEKSIFFDFKKDGKTYAFSGRIDKILLTKEGDNTYYTIIDYKSGHEEFSPFGLTLGKSIQLPLYYYGIEHSRHPEDFRGDAEFGGFLMQKVYFRLKNEIVDDKGYYGEDGLLKLTRLCGPHKSTLNYLNSLDATAADLEKLKPKSRGGTFLAPAYAFTYPSGDENLLGDKSGLPRYNIEDLVEHAKEGAAYVIESIKKSDFPIRPTGFDLMKADLSHAVCKYCPYRDVCYVKLSKAFKSYKAELNKKLDIRPKTKKKEDDGKEAAEA